MRQTMMVRPGWRLMRRAAGAVACAIGLFLTPAVFGQSASSQTASTATAAEAAEAGEALRQGLELESQQRWSEALTHYEEAVRHFPQRQDLQQRLALARIHYDLGRRYADPSFVTAQSEMTLEQALEVFAEVAGKLDYHYVDEPDWTRLLQWGTEGLRAALATPAFRDRHGVAPTREATDGLVKQIRAALAQHPVRDRGEARDVVRWASELTRRRIGLDPAVAALEFACSLLSSLDNYSTFLTQQQLDEVYSQIEGNFVGLGIELKTDSDQLVITHVISGGPADAAGLEAGERIVAVDGRSIGELTPQQAADMLKGEQGTQVVIDLASPDGTQRRVTVRRDRVEVPSVENVQIVDAENGVGYFRLSSFQKTTSHEIDSALWNLNRRGMRSLIIDLRGNPGGSLPECVEVVDKFIAEGTIVRTRGRSAQEDFDYQAHRVGTWRIPLVLLIDKDSASASEIFAGAVRDHHRATIVGQRSYGKGSVQGIFPLRTFQGGVRLTTAKFFSPSGQPISPMGVTPDIPVHIVARPVAAGQPLGSAQDPVLNAAIDVARQRLAQR